MRESDPEGNPWGVEFQQGLFNMTSDSNLFRTAGELEERGAERVGNLWRKGSDKWLPLYEAKMMHQFNHRWGDYALSEVTRGDSQLPEIPQEQLSDSNYLVQPRYWVTEADVRERLRHSLDWLLAFRDVTNATNERTMIVSALPLAGVGNNAPLIFSARPSELTATLIGILNSFVFDYCTRLKIGWTHINFFIAKQLPVLPPSVLQQAVPWEPSQSAASWMNTRVLELVFTASDMAGFAASVGYSGVPLRWDQDRRRLLRADLDAACFHLYGLDRPEVAYVMETFPIIRQRDEAKHGEYLTKRLILERYDELS